MPRSSRPIYLFTDYLTCQPTPYGQKKLTELFAYLDKHLGEITAIACHSYRRLDGCLFVLDIAGNKGTLALTLIPDTQYSWADYFTENAPLVLDADIYLTDATDAFKLMQYVSQHYGHAVAVFEWNKHLISVFIILQKSP